MFNSFCHKVAHKEFHFFFFFSISAILCTVILATAEKIYFNLSLILYVL